MMPTIANAVIPPTNRNAGVRWGLLRHAMAIKSGNTLMTAKTMGCRASAPITARNAASSSNKLAKTPQIPPAASVSFRCVSILVASKEEDGFW